ncbi:MAG: DNA-binding protein [Planctomycetota bacterium]|nr:MAG: DNA-binding protein [Planctomycetota bacterium]
MAQLIVRQLEDSLAQLLKERAQRHGHSTEEEHRQILRQALTGGVSFKQALASIPAVGDDEDFTRVPQLPREINW